ncbi:hypothetical protein AB4144_56195, partial [Rhizobiaceae sp. 2RAB30]
EKAHQWIQRRGRGSIYDLSATLCRLPGEKLDQTTRRLALLPPPIFPRACSRPTNDLDAEAKLETRINFNGPCGIELMQAISDATAVALDALISAFGRLIGLRRGGFGEVSRRQLLLGSGQPV